MVSSKVVRCSRPPNGDKSQHGMKPLEILREGISCAKMQVSKKHFKCFFKIRGMVHGVF